MSIVESLSDIVGPSALGQLCRWSGKEVPVAKEGAAHPDIISGIQKDLENFRLDTTEVGLLGVFTKGSTVGSILVSSPGDRDLLAEVNYAVQRIGPFRRVILPWPTDDVMRLSSMELFLIVDDVKVPLGEFYDVCSGGSTFLVFILEG